MERVIRFPVTVMYYEEPHFDHDSLPRWRKTITSCPSDWNRLTASMDVLEETQFQYKQSTYHGIRTGRLSGITVLDIDYNCPMAKLIHAAIGDTFPRTVRSINGGSHFYFEYEPGLASIYNVREGVTVLNDGRFTLLGFNHYVKGNQPITQMSKALVAMLLDMQRARSPIRQSAYELISILPAEWITDRNCLARLIRALTTLDIPSTLLIDTLRQCIVDKTGYVDEYELKLLINTKPSQDVKRFTYAKLIKIVREDHQDKFIEWNAKWNTKRPAKKILAAIKPKLSYRHGAMTKLSDLKAFDSKLTAKTLLVMNPEYIVSIRKLCKHCSNAHEKGCCDLYQYGDRVSVRMVNNITIS
jgi:hypothetical protein